MQNMKKKIWKTVKGIADDVENTVRGAVDGIEITKGTPIRMPKVTINGEPILEKGKHCFNAIAEDVKGLAQGFTKVVKDVGFKHTKKEFGKDE